MSAKNKKKMRLRTHRYTSNVFSMFNQAQIQEFKVREQGQGVKTKGAKGKDQLPSGGKVSDSRAKEEGS